MYQQVDCKQKTSTSKLLNNSTLMRLKDIRMNTFRYKQKNVTGTLKSDVKLFQKDLDLKEAGHRILNQIE